MELLSLEMDTLGLPNLTADVNGTQGEAVFVAIVRVDSVENLLLMTVIPFYG